MPILFYAGHISLIASTLVVYIVLNIECLMNTYLLPTSLGPRSYMYIFVALLLACKWQGHIWGNMKTKNYMY